MSYPIHYHDVSRETWKHHLQLIDRFHDPLEVYMEKLLWWNQKVNLVSRNADKPLIWKHISHSLLPLSLDLLPAEWSLFDAGTGGGLPGLPLSIVSPDRTFILNDINFKKVTAVRQMAATLDLENVTTQRGDFTKYTPSSPYTLISKHSFKLREVVGVLNDDDYCRQIVLFKGSDFTDEYEQLSHSPRIEAYRLDAQTSDSFFSDKLILNIRSSSST